MEERGDKEEIDRCEHCIRTSTNRFCLLGLKNQREMTHFEMTYKLSKGKEKHFILFPFSLGSCSSVFELLHSSIHSFVYSFLHTYYDATILWSISFSLLYNAT